VKLRWVLAHHRKMEEIRRVMESNISGEISARREGVEELV
jgi:hypothetical protein